MKERMNELAEAYGEVIDAEIEALLAEENGPHVFSESFENRMNELIRTGKPKSGKRAGAKRWLIIAIAAVLALAATACAVPEIRESIAGFFVKVFGDHVEYVDPNVTKNSIEEEYGIVPIPEGFAVTNSVKTDSSLVVTYTDDSQHSIILRQIADKNYSINVDSEHGSFEEYELFGKDVRIQYGADGAQAAWVQDGYYFTLTYPDEVSLETFEEWIASVRPIDSDQQ